MNASKLCKLLRTEPLKERAGWNMAHEKKEKKVAHKRTEPYDALERTEKKKKPQNKEATRNMNRERTTLKRSKWRKA